MREIQTKYVKLEKQERYTFLSLKACVVTNLSMKVVQRRGNNSQKQLNIIYHVSKYYIRRYTQTDLLSR